MKRFKLRYESLELLACHSFPQFTSDTHRWPAQYSFIGLEQIKINLLNVIVPKRPPHIQDELKTLYAI